MKTTSMIDQTHTGLISPITNKKRTTKSSFWRRCKSQKLLIIIAIPIILYVFIFRYIPLWGWLMAFQEYSPTDKLLQSPWVGLVNFKELFSDDRLFLVLRNTLGMSIINLTTGTLAAIFFALVLNETRNVFVKKIVQTVSYLPYFVSWIVASSIVITFLSIDNGTLNNLLMSLHVINKPVLWLAHPEYFWGIIAISAIWKNVGFSAIVYLASMSGIDPTMYEAASIDGAGRLKRIWHVTLPGILPTIVILLILNIGGILNLGLEQQLLLGNNLVLNVSEVIDIYVLRYGISMGRYSYAIAAGMSKSIVSILLLTGANALSKRLGQQRLY
jgi:putative aldouronate transport system permease protein